MDQFSPSLIPDLIWATWIKNVAEYNEQGIQMWAEGLGGGPEEVEEGTKDWAVLDVVFLQRKGSHKDRKNLVERYSGIVAVDKSCDSACRIVLGIQPGSVGIWSNIEQGAKGSKERKILLGQIDRRVFHQETNSKTCVALDFRLSITESPVKEFQQGLGVRSDGALDPRNDFC